MKNTKTLILVAGMLALALSITAAPRTAQAGGFAEYRTGMAGLIGDIDRWSADLNAFVGGLATKPQLACSTEFAVLVRSGSSLADDLVGTGRQAPRSLAGSHDRAVAGMTETVAGARLIACTCNGGTLGDGLARIQHGQAEFAGGMLRIEGFVHGYGRPK